jgi:hypothetical protein
MYFEKPTEESPVKSATVHLINMGIMAAGTVGLWIFWTPLMQFIGASFAQWYPAAAVAVAQ